MPTPPTHLTLIGLGPLGSSLALNLKTRPEFQLTGFDFDPTVRQQAAKQNLTHSVENDLRKSVKSADLIVLSTSLDDQREVLSIIGAEMKAGSVVVCCAPLLNLLLQWGNEHLSADRHLIACHVALRPTQLDAPAAADLLTHSLWAMAVSPKCSSAALDAVNALIEAVGGTPYFFDAVEHDSLMSSTEALPALVAHAVWQATSGPAGWREARKIASENFILATEALAEPTVLLHTSEHVVNYLDSVITELQAMRQKLAAGEQADFGKTLAEATAYRARWLNERETGQDASVEPITIEVPTTIGETLQKIFIGRRLSQKRPPTKTP